MCGTASGMIFEKSKILRSSGGWSTHGAALRAKLKLISFILLLFKYVFTPVAALLC